MASSSLSEEAVLIDPETQFLMEIRMKSKLQNQTKEENEEKEEEEGEEEGDEWEWEKYKENVRPLKRGRNIEILNQSLKSHSLLSLKTHLLNTRRELIQAIDDYKGDDPLLPWLQCIKWVQEAFPAGGDSSGLVVIYEQCVRTLWHDDRYRNDHRYLKIWLEYAENCSDAEVIYRFLDANKIGQSHAAYYISFALHMESKNKVKTASEIFNRGLSINAQPQEKLEAAFRKFIARSMRRSNTVTDEDTNENGQPARSFGAVLARGESRRSLMENSEVSRKNNTNANGTQRSALSVYKDTNLENNPSHQADPPKLGSKSWDTLATHRDRNKENTALPSKWTTFKVPQRPGTRLGGAVTTGVEVFIDEECSELYPTDTDQNPSDLQLKERDENDLTREAELLRENPLRNFPTHSFPR